MASRAAMTAISARTDSSSLDRSGITGRMISGSTMPDRSTTNRDLMPEALVMNSGEEGARASTVPAAISAAWVELKRST